MLSFLSNTRVYLAAGATDLRKSFDTLAGVVRESLRLDPLSGYLLVFTNSRENVTVRQSFHLPTSSRRQKSRKF